MKVKIFEDEINYTRTIPFEIEINGVVYEGVLIETGNKVGGLELDPDYEITWNSDIPNIDERELIGILRKEIYQTE